MADGIEFTLEYQNKRFDSLSAGFLSLITEFTTGFDGAVQAVSNEMQDFLTKVAAEIASKNGSPWPGGTSDSTVSLRTGGLVASILGSVQVTGSTLGTLKGYIGAGFPGSIQETGATITPKTGQFLAVPLPAALDSRGVPLRRSPRDWGNTFVARTRAGNLVIFLKNGTQITPLYVLKTQVTLRPRLHLEDSLDSGLPYFTQRAADSIIAAMTRRLLG